MSHLKNILTISLIFTAATAASANESDYQQKISILNYQTDGAIGTEDYDSSARLFHYAYFFDKVDTSAGPWQLASFMQRSGFIAFQTVASESTYSRSNSDGRSDTLSTQIANKESPLVIDLSYTQGESDTSGPSTYSSDSKNYNLSIGYYVQPYTLITVGHSESKTEYSDSPSHSESKTNDINIAHVQLREASTAIALTADYRVTKYQTGTEIRYTTLAADYFLNTRLGVGVSISTIKSDLDINNRKTLGVNASYFINPQIEISAAYSKDKADNTERGFETDSLQLYGALYF